MSLQAKQRTDRRLSDPHGVHTDSHQYQTIGGGLVGRKKVFYGTPLKLPTAFNSVRSKDFVSPQLYNTQYIRQPRR